MHGNHAPSEGGDERTSPPKFLKYDIYANEVFKVCLKKIKTKSQTIPDLNKFCFSVETLLFPF